MSKHTPTPWRVSNIDAHGGYDGMTDAIHVGPITLDAADYGQLCAGDDRYDKARMIADASLISESANYHARLVEALRRMVAAEDCSRDAPGILFDAAEEARTLLAELEQQP